MAAGQGCQEVSRLGQAEDHGSHWWVGTAESGPSAPLTCTGPSDMDMRNGYGSVM